ncbi:MAG TPA: GNAT family N-acetyltransferase [Streptosporangiaceae bacterium]
MAQLTLIANAVAGSATRVPGGYAVRAPRPEDADQLGRLYFDCQVPGADLGDVAEGVDEVRAFFRGEFGEFWPEASGVIETGGLPVAVLLAVHRAPWEDTPDCPFITDLFTEPEYRRFGFARVLLQRCLTQASASARPEVALRVDSDNAPALRLYESLGFRPRQGEPPHAVLADAVVRWVLGVVDGERLTLVTGLRAGGSPWLVRYEGADGGGAVVLRTSGPEVAGRQALEVQGIGVAQANQLPVAGVIAARADDDGALLLLHYIDGSSRQPAEPDQARLEALGAIAARISVTDPGAAALPAVAHPIPDVDFDEMRAAAPAQPLLEAARERVAAIMPADPVGFVHGDLWCGNTLWRSERLVAVIDWDCAGLGAAGIDVGSLRGDAALCYGIEAADHVLAGWQREAGRPAESVAYWDVVAMLCTPPDMGLVLPAISSMTGRTDLTAELLRERRDMFLTDALDRLG